MRSYIKVAFKSTEQLVAPAPAFNPTGDGREQFPYFAFLRLHEAGMIEFRNLICGTSLAFEPGPIWWIGYSFDGVDWIPWKNFPPGTLDAYVPLVEYSLHPAN